MLRRLGALFFAVALLAGCTATFTYNHLDWLIPWWVDGYVDLSREQRQLLQQRLEPALRWHREEELLRYAQWLDEVDTALSGPVTTTEVEGWMNDLVTAAERLEDAVLEVALDFGETMSDIQLAEFMESVWERHRKYEEEFLERSDTAYREDQFDEMSGYARRLIGRLSPEQERVLLQAAEDMQRLDTAWLEEHELWLQRVGPLMQHGPGWKDAIRAAHQERRKNRTVRYHEIFDHNLAVISTAFADVLNQMSQRQRTHASREIEKLHKKLFQLARDTRMGPAAELPQSATGAQSTAVGGSQ
jgi:hypothetical protein